MSRTVTRRVQRWVVSEPAPAQSFKPRRLPFRDEVAPLVYRLPIDPKGLSDSPAPAVEPDNVVCQHDAVVNHTTPSDVNYPIPDNDYTQPSEAECGADVKLSEMVRAARRAKGLSQGELARRVGVTKAAISWIEAGRTKSLKGDTLAGLARELGLNVDAMTGKRISTARLVSGTVGPSRPNNPTNRVRVLGTATLSPAGYWTDIEPLDGSLDFPSDDPDAYALRVAGDAMHPRIKSGEFVVAEPSHEYGPGDEVIISLRDGRYLLREFAYRRDNIVAFNGVTNGRLTLTEADIVHVHFIAAIVKPVRFRT